VARVDVTALTPRQSMGVARTAEMFDVARQVHGDAFAATVWAAVHARVLMRAFDDSPPAERLHAARAFMDGVREVARNLKLRPGQLSEALRHARVVYREGFER
jgi:hypothetical protein